MVLPLPLYYLSIGLFALDALAKGKDRERQRLRKQRRLGGYIQPGHADKKAIARAAPVRRSNRYADRLPIHLNRPHQLLHRRTLHLVPERQNRGYAL